MAFGNLRTVGVDGGPSTPIAWVFANAAARTAFTPTTGVPSILGNLTADDLDRVALQVDDGTLWRLTATTPTWQQIGGGGAGGGEFRVPLFPFLRTPFGSDWPVQVAAQFTFDSLNPALPVWRFDAGTEEGVGWGMRVPTGFTTLGFEFSSRGQGAGGGTAALNLYTRTVSNGSPITSWSAGTALSSLSLAASTNPQDDTDSVSLATLGLTAGSMANFELTRDGGTLATDWTLFDATLVFT